MYFSGGQMSMRSWEELYHTPVQVSIYLTPPEIRKRDWYSASSVTRMYKKPAAENTRCRPVL
jgi:hypothetical protein